MRSFMLSGGPFQHADIICIVNVLLAFFVARTITRHGDSSYCILCIHYPMFASIHTLDGVRRRSVMFVELRV
ncbi:hypothetical protein BDR04DRAFT_873198 [Suillus decipiens]|nr:hypothetical protein BDR04DRAFT_873198 [Suillus decipiens]